MGVVNIRTKGTYDSTMISLNKYSSGNIIPEEFLVYIAEKGITSLAAATPAKTGKTAACWYYTIERRTDGKIELSWKNSYMAKDVPIAILIDRGHATRSGNWVAGKHFIRKAIEPVLAELVEYIDKGGII